MPTGTRIRHNNVFGVTTDNPLTIGATTLNSSGLQNLPVVASAHAVITLDPLRQHGEPEIVIVTAHTASATVVTIQRGAYGTVARQHPQGTVWVHAPVTEDVIPILTSSTRPSDPYRGERIFETDTNRFVARSTADTWQQDGLFFDPPACLLSTSGAQTISNNTLTKVTWDIETYDTASMHSTSSDTSRITATVAGIYIVTAHTFWASDTDTTEMLARFLVNGTTDYGQWRIGTSGGISGTQHQCISATIYCAVNDYIEVEVRQGNISANTLAVRGNRFGATWVGRGN